MTETQKATLEKSLETATKAVKKIQDELKALEIPLTQLTVRKTALCIDLLEAEVLELKEAFNARR
jgi:hypothetical protein